ATVHESGAMHTTSSRQTPMYSFGGAGSQARDTHGDPTGIVRFASSASTSWTKVSRGTPFSALSVNRVAICGSSCCGRQRTRGRGRTSLNSDMPFTARHQAADAEYWVEPGLEPLALAGRTFRSRLLVGTGKYKDFETMQRCLDASGCEVVTVAVRRERLYNEQGQSLLDFIDTSRYTILPNTAGCFTAEDAVRVARLGRELLDQLGNPGKDWVKLEVLGDKKKRLPDAVRALEDVRELVA